MTPAERETIRNEVFSQNSADIAEVILEHRLRRAQRHDDRASHLTDQREQLFAQRAAIEANHRAELARLEAEMVARQREFIAAAELLESTRIAQQQYRVALDEQIQAITTTLAGPSAADRVIGGWAKNDLIPMVNDDLAAKAEQTTFSPYVLGVDLQTGTVSSVIAEGMYIPIMKPNPKEVAAANAPRH